MKQTSIPEIGKKYHFFDDGKCSDSRHYIAECVNMITPKEAKKVTFTFGEGDEQYTTNLWTLWKKQCEECRNKKGSFLEVLGADKQGYWLYSPETDYFICCKVNDYDDNLLWFVRTVKGRWFSLDIQSDWQSGELDVDCEKYNIMVNECGEDFYSRKIS